MDNDTKRLRQDYERLVAQTDEDMRAYARSTKPPLRALLIALVFVTFFLTAWAIQKTITSAIPVFWPKPSITFRQSVLLRDVK